MGVNDYKAFISNGKVISISGITDIIDIEESDQVIQADECTCTNRDHISSCQIVNLALPIKTSKSTSEKYVVEMAFCKECGAYYIPQKSYEDLSGKGEIPHSIRGGIILFKYLQSGSAFNEERERLDNIKRELKREEEKIPETIGKYGIDDGCGGLKSFDTLKTEAIKASLKREEIDELLNQPYIGRLDLHKDEGKDKESIYIGKAEDITIGNTMIYSSWSEYGDLFSSTAEPSGTVYGQKRNVDLRRRIDIRGGDLKVLKMYSRLILYMLSRVFMTAF